MPDVDIEVSITGRLFRSAQRRGVMAEFIRTAVDDVTAQVYADVMGNLNRSIRHPTPYYETQITTTRRSTGGAAQASSIRRVHDRGIVYGPWLEGTSERNRTTRFKGYASFRRARQSVQDRVPQLVDRALRRCIAGLGG